MTTEQRDNPIQRLVAAGEVALWALLYVVLVLLILALVLFTVPPALLVVVGVVTAIAIVVWLVYRKKDHAVSATGAIAREDRCLVFCLHVADGVMPEQGYAIRSMLNDSGTNGWWFVNPGTFIAVFPSLASEDSRLSSCQAALAQLAAANPSWPSVAAGHAEGSIFGAFSSDGILESMPTGAVASLAMKRAIGHAS